MKRELWPCRVCGVHVRQKEDCGVFVTVVRRKRIVARWAEHGACRGKEPQGGIHGAG